MSGKGIDGEWRLASQVRGLFDEQTPALEVLSSTLEDLFAPETSAPKESPAARNANRRSETKPAPTPPASITRELVLEIDVPPAIVPTQPAIESPVVERPPVRESFSTPTLKFSEQTESEQVNDLAPRVDLPTNHEPESIRPAPLE